MRKFGCLRCDFQAVADDFVAEFLARDEVPDCPDCGGLLKHATISFGQALPTSVLQTAVSWSRSADLFLALGSSLVVTPAADLPRLAHEHGAALVIINRDPTPLDGLADVVINESISATLIAIAEALQGLAD